jgi:glycine/D-amino acid oxidase-like deaminating enzyme
MKQIFSDFAYGDGPRDGCWWDETCTLPQHPVLQGQLACDVAIIGGGFTGLSAALHLARAGASVILVEAQQIGWGSSGRNGGFCCLGGGKASDAMLDRKFGRDGRLEWRGAEHAAVDLVGHLVSSLDLDVDRHSTGETLVAHRARDVAEFEQHAISIAENYGVTPEIISRDQLAERGMAGPFHGAMTTPIGFGLNPRKYLHGLVAAALDAGVRLFECSAVTGIAEQVIKTKAGAVRAERIILATNGYSSEDLPEWMAARYMPAQSTVLVTRPLTKAEVAAQGWSTDQMAYDTRNLLHYFRLLPDRRFLFGMRGGLRASPGTEAQARAAVVRDFRQMFPAWSDVDVSHSWSGLVCLARNQLPFVGPVPGQAHLLAGFAYHGNGVAMGTFAGHLLADLALGKTPALYPAAMRAPAARFPLGTMRRAIMPPLYASLYLRDLGT